ncbi:hypothetical protein [Streptomyces mirabilis]|uniref:hypothetical protein n=1 Tax=Streptomyces mirabilis TaxID=68239 RepID=UPI00331A09F5
MTLKKRHKQVDQQQFKAPARDVRRQHLTAAEAVAEADRNAARARSVAGTKSRNGHTAAEAATDPPSGGPNCVAVVGPEGSYRSVVGASPLGPKALVGQVFEGETLLASAEITHSDYTDVDGKLADVLHQVKVTWEVSCGANVVDYDLGQVVTAHSGAYSLVHPEVIDPVVTLQVMVDPKQCAGVVPNTGNFFILARATVVDVTGGGTGGAVTGMTLAHGIPDDQTYGCAAECASLRRPPLSDQRVCWSNKGLDRVIAVGSVHEGRASR